MHSSVASVEENDNQLMFLLIINLFTDVDVRCKEFDNGTSLHIAASNLCLDGAKCLVSVDQDPIFEMMIMNFIKINLQLLN